MKRRIINLVSKSDAITFLAQKIYYHFYKDLSKLSLHINSECNYKCKYCYSVSKKPKKPINWMNIIKQAIELKVKCISFLGGEPLLDPKLKEYISFCERNNINVIVFTNGLCLDKKNIEFFKNLKNKPILAVKYSDEEFYRKYTSKNTFKRISKNIQDCVDNGIKVMAYIAITGNNYSRADKIIQKAIKLGAIPIFDRYIPTNKKCDNELELNKEQWKEANDKIAKLIKNRKTNPSMKLKAGNCPCYVDALSIDIYGNAKPCSLSPDSQIIGNLREKDLKQVWKIFLRLRKKWMNIPSACKNCKQKYSCHGGCKNYSLMKKGTVNCRDPLCDGTVSPTIGQCGFEIKD